LFNAHIIISVNSVSMIKDINTDSKYLYSAMLLRSVSEEVEKKIVQSSSVLKEMNTHAILCCLVKSLNCVVYEHILIKRVTEKVKRMLTAVNVNKVFT